jgi:hypothetical protein
MAVAARLAISVYAKQHERQKENKIASHHSGFSELTMPPANLRTVRVMMYVLYKLTNNIFIVRYAGTKLWRNISVHHFSIINTKSPVVTTADE